MALVETIKKAWFHPKEFYAGLGSADIGAAWKYYALISLVPLVLLLILFGAMGAVFVALIPGLGAVAPLLGGLFLAIPILMYIGMVILIFVAAAISHIFVYLVGGRQGYGRTFQASTYGSTPGVLLGWIPLIGIIFFIWSIYTYICGISVLHKMSMGRAFLSWLIPLIIAAVVTFAIVGAAILTIAGLASAGAGYPYGAI